MFELNKIIHGDAEETLKGFPDKSVNCFITSPPYWQKRDYGFEGQWGLEPTFEEYLERLWRLAGQMYRVLADDGTVWINLGDTYGSVSGAMRYGEFGILNTDNQPIKQPISIDKCLLLLPHRFAIGCIDRGWIMRNDIVWGKRNGMPESVTDRFTNKHEYFFLMVKNQKYYFDLDGIRDKHRTHNKGRDFNNKKSMNAYPKGPLYSGGKRGDSHPNGKNPGSVSDFWDILVMPCSNGHYATYNTNLISNPILAGCFEGGIICDPFCGMGTTGVRAIELNRKFIGIDGNKGYCNEAQKLIDKELSKTQMFDIAQS